MKNTLFSILSLAIIAFAASCSKPKSSPATTASVMFVHGCASGTTNVSLDAEIGGVKVNGATSLSFLSKSGYEQVTAGSGINLSFFVSGLSQLTNQTVSMTVNNHYSAFAGGSITSPGICYTTDDLTAPTSGMAKVRFVNLSPDNLNTNCYLGTVKVDSNIGYLACSSFHNVAAGTGLVGMYDQTTPSKSGVISSQTLVSGKIYTFMLTGTASGSGSSVYTLTLINNN